MARVKEAHQPTLRRRLFPLGQLLLAGLKALGLKKGIVRSACADRHGKAKEAHAIARKAHVTARKAHVSALTL